MSAYLQPASIDESDKQYIEVTQCGLKEDRNQASLFGVRWQKFWKIAYILSSEFILFLLRAARKTIY